MWHTVRYNACVALFYSGQRRILNIFSIWPQEGRWLQILHSLNFWHVFCYWILIFDLILLLHVVLNISQMEEVIKGFFLLSTCIAYTMKVICLKLNNVAALKLFEQLHSSDYKPSNLQEQRMFLEASELSRRLRNIYGVTSVSSLCMVLVTQYFIDNTQLPLATYSPFDVSQGSFGYWFTYVYHCVALSGACFLNISFDSLCCSLFIFVRCQLDMLALRLENLGQEEVCAEKLELQLKTCIKYFMNIVELAAEVERLLYMPISVQIFCSVLVLTANFYAMSLLADDKLVFLKFFIYQSCMVMQIFMICYFAGEITQRSLKLPHNLYASNWVDCSRAHRRLILMFMQRLDYAIRIRTINASHAFDLMLFSSIVNCSYSYFALLKRVNN
ncbi:odorant receptor 46a [Drosophila busckii]|uniref:odorant receptor 46a n=1 Tax=Drosophila busckii TaxID=30019 RepID=UPI001432BF76|nr:odorant receptor 46a [Drosophila busckii]